MKIIKNKRPNYPEVFPIKSEPYGQPYVTWTEKWWQWAFSIPRMKNPVVDTTGENCGSGQDGPVWYLAGTTGNKSHAQRTCIMPQKKGILFPILVSLFSHLEKPNLNTEGLIRYTAKDIDLTSTLEAIVDGNALTHLSRYRVKSYFHLDLVEDNIWDVKAGSTKAASDGFWVFLKPLNEGNHTISFQGVEPNFKTKVSYNIKIV